MMMMKVVVDNEIVKILAHDPSQVMKHPSIIDPENCLSFGWPSFLEYLELGSLFTNLPVFDQANSLFQACLSALCVNEEKEALFHLYDHLFADHLTQIKNLPQITAPFLLDAIKTQRQKPVFLVAEKILFPILAHFERELIEETSNTMHDLILYLAWDRMCVCLGKLFDYQSADPKFIKGLEVFKECLIESYQHIFLQGRTSPGIYRMMEALLFYQMREENVQKHTAAEWATLAQSFPLLKKQDELADFFYIDEAVTSTSSQNSDCNYLTLELPEKVNSRLNFARLMMEKLAEEVPQWNFILEPKKIICINF